MFGVVAQLDWVLDSGCSDDQELFVRSLLMGGESMSDFIEQRTITQSKEASNET